MKTLTGSIFGSGDDEQMVIIEIAYYHKPSFFSPYKIIVNCCRIINMLTIKPSDLYIDVQLAIAQELGVEPGVIDIQSEIEIPNVVTQKKITEPLFI